MINLKTAAIYSRKSKYTAKGESIEQQINACKDYLKRLNIEEYIIYEDEGFSAKSTERPRFKQMMKDATTKKFDVLICYRLDRVSRNVADFSILISKLEKLNIGFISVSENFDTITPLGRAMMFISSVFAQLERETIAERVSDNMIELAKEGKWLGGTTPLGYKSERVEFNEVDGKQKSYFKLSPVQNELKIVEEIFDKYLEFKSLSQVEKFLLANNIKTRKNKDWAKGKIKYILTNPIYVKATQSVIAYLEEIGIPVWGDYDGLHGLLSYNKTKNKHGNDLKELKDWVYAVCNAEGIIDAESWINVQKLLIKNKDKAPRFGKSNKALLTGFLRCAICGSPMRIKYGGENRETGERKYFYACTLKYSSGHTRCKNKNADAALLDSSVINELKEICSNSGLLIERLKAYKEKIKEYSPDNEINFLTTSIDQCAISVNNLLDNLSLTSNKTVAKDILKKIEDLNLQKSEYEKRLNSLSESEKLVQEYQLNIDAFIQSYFRFANMIDYVSYEEKKLLIASVAKNVYWDGNAKKVRLEMVGSD